MNRRPAGKAPTALARWAGGVELLGDTYAQITAGIHEFHRAIARQPFRTVDAIPTLGSGAAPVRVLHDGITDAVYTGVREIGALAFTLAGGALKLVEQQTSEVEATASAHPRTDLAFSALSGLFGDHLIGRRNPVAPQFGLYVDGLKIETDRSSLAARFPDAEPRLVVFVHGLCCNETSWQLYRQAGVRQSLPYGARLAEHGYTPLYLRYNSGAHISQNGRRLARLLQQLLTQWPRAVEDITLIGHSMGGLVIRSAAAAGLRRGDAWTGKVGSLICLGSPHQGAALERGAQALAQVLQGFELSRPWARVLEARSVGIRDLRFGATSDADWRDGLKRDWRPPASIARLADAQYHFIGCSVGDDEHDWRGKLLGDGLVHLPSSLAKELADADTAVLFRRHHMQLLNDPAVYALIAERLGVTTPPAASPAHRRTVQPRRAARPRR
ncbi:esterase/lipase family protein [Solimonas terrae]|uniref:Alpha/beta fold hydrolase n=1 Tax=Solimonas terrae TaxID=1396819 RepID=A0A6M2BSR6_9GAMM|nr:alpha/beta fold hydrolase [Solimonas terrae]NGY05163.1 alpha/beta fold hydrolase [Solimonas terrae]